MKREFKGTKGSWYHDTELENVNQYSVKVNVISSDSDENMVDIFGDDEEAKANVNLIATAPELLECLMELENDNGSIPKIIWDKIQKTIDKALGL